MSIVAVRQPDGSIVWDYDSKTPGIQGRRQDAYGSRDEFLAKDPYMVERNRRATYAEEGWKNYGTDQAALEELAAFLQGDPWWEGRLSRYYDEAENGGNRIFRNYGTASDELFNQRAGTLNRYRALRNAGWDHGDITRVLYPTSQAYTPTFDNYKGENHSSVTSLIPDNKVTGGNNPKEGDACIADDGRPGFRNYLLQCVVPETMPNNDPSVLPPKDLTGGLYGPNNLFNGGNTDMAGLLTNSLFSTLFEKK